MERGDSDDRCCCLGVDEDDDNDDDDTATDENERGTGENAVVVDVAARKGAASKSDFIVFLGGIILICASNEDPRVVPSVINVQK